MTAPAVPPANTTYPARLEIDYQEKLSRASTIFRIILIIPVAIIAGILTSGSGSAVLVVNQAGDVVREYSSSGAGIIGALFLVTVLVILFRKRYPRWWFDFNLALHRFLYRIATYLFVLTDRYPSTEDEQNIHLDADYPDAQRDLMRGMPLVKWFLAIPHYVILFFLWIAAYVVIIVGWFAVIILGRYPRGLFDFVVGVMRWSWRVQAYAFLLVTDRYPPFRLSQ